MTHIRRKRGGIVVGTSLDRRGDRRGIVARPSSTVTPPEVMRASVAYGASLAALHAATGDDVVKAKRARRDAKYRLTKLVGPEAVAHYASALEMDGGLFLRALAGAPVDVREHALVAALNGAQVALEHGIVSHGAMVLLASSSVWRALATAYLHKSIEMGGNADLDKRAAIAGAQSRLDMLAGLDLSRSPIISPVREKPIDSQAILTAQLKKWDDELLAEQAKEAAEKGIGRGVQPPTVSDDDGEGG